MRRDHFGDVKYRFGSDFSLFAICIIGSFGIYVIEI